MNIIKKARVTIDGFGKLNQQTKIEDGIWVIPGEIAGSSQVIEIRAPEDRLEFVVTMLCQALTGYVFRQLEVYGEMPS